MVHYHHHFHWGSTKIVQDAVVEVEGTLTMKMFVWEEGRNRYYRHKVETLAEAGRNNYVEQVAVEVG